MTISQAREVLNLSEHFTLKTLKKKFRDLLKKWHPDINKNGEEMTRTIIEAYRYLQSETSSYDDEVEEPKQEFKEKTRKREKTQKSTQKSKGYTGKYEKNLWPQYNLHKQLSEQGVRDMISFLLKSRVARDIYDIWITQDKRVFLVRDLTFSHLGNILKYLQKPTDSNFDCTDYYYRIKAEFERRTKMDLKDLSGGFKIKTHDSRRLAK